MSDLEQVIADSIGDAVDTTPEVDVEVEASTDTPVEASSESTETTESTDEGSTSSEVASPGAAAAKAEAGDAQGQDNLDQFGVQRESVPGRENRIPYSRVTKIVGKAVSEAQTKAKGEWEPKVQALEGELHEYKTYHQKVQNFEKTMLTDHRRFLTLLNGIPGYAELLAPIFAPQQQAAPQQAAPAVDDMPQPDVELENGNKVYSMDGLKKLNEWNRLQAKKEALEEVQKTYGPLAESFAQYQARAQRQAELAPIIEAQVADARTWPHFAENEAEIVQVLAQYPDVSLEGAYRHVVVGKLQEQAGSAQVERAKLEKEMRAKILAEIKGAPTSTSAPRSGSKPSTQSSGPRSLEDIIREQVASAGTSQNLF